MSTTVSLILPQDPIMIAFSAYAVMAGGNHWGPRLGTSLPPARNRRRQRDLPCYSSRPWRKGPDSITYTLNTICIVSTGADYFRRGGADFCAARAIPARSPGAGEHFVRVSQKKAFCLGAPLWLVQEIRRTQTIQDRKHPTQGSRSLAAPP